MKAQLYSGFLKRIAKEFDDHFSKIEAHYGFDYGSEFEIAVCKALRQVLPQRYGVCRGFVVDRAGNHAGDDIIIYERLHFPLIRSTGEDDFSQKQSVPIEAAAAYLEAKYTLNLDRSRDN